MLTNQKLSGYAENECRKKLVEVAQKCQCNGSEVGDCTEHCEISQRTIASQLSVFDFSKQMSLVQDCVVTSSLEFPIELGCEYEWAQLITAVNINWPEQIEANFGKAIGKILAQDRATAMSLLSSLEWKNIVCASLWLDLTRQQSRLCRLRIFYCSSVNMNAERGAWKKFNFICKGGKGEKGLLERVAWYEA